MKKINLLTLLLALLLINSCDQGSKVNEKAKQILGNDSTTQIYAGLNIPSDTSQRPKYTLNPTIENTVSGGFRIPVSLSANTDLKNNRLFSSHLCDDLRNNISNLEYVHSFQLSQLNTILSGHDDKYLDILFCIDESNNLYPVLNVHGLPQYYKPDGSGSLVEIGDLTTLAADYARYVAFAQTCNQTLYSHCPIGQISSNLSTYATNHNITKVNLYFTMLRDLSYPILQNNFSTENDGQLGTITEYVDSNGNIQYARDLNNLCPYYCY